MNSMSVNGFIRLGGSTYVGVVAARSSPEYDIFSIRVKDGCNDGKVGKVHTPKSFFTMH